ncbi:hypothetical protein K469DRAFT_310400 [Zopfia rhizophila CBS 207.26]|uniref:Uncharacterized protein n=1 Tax=Zopfia rhizophila CBS 207.26 TaxID=1314779 RepID=A0A6A6EJR8_9PEZI|nr:hypothetical protein K469DRAFT_310400 [Zopfia rhizophila CBS 207.26]
MYVDDFEVPRARRAPPPDHAPPSNHKGRPRKYCDDDFGPEELRRVPRRRRSHRDMRYYPESEDESPPPPRRHHRREPRPRDYDDGSPLPRRHRRQEPRPRDYGDYDEYPPPRRDLNYGRGGGRQNDGHFSENRYDKRRLDPYFDDYKSERDRYRDDRLERSRKAAKPKDKRKEKRWQKEALGMFKDYAVPIIKAEGRKYISKEIGNFISRQGK